MITTGALQAYTTSLALDGPDKKIIYYALCQDTETLQTWYTAVATPVIAGVPTGPIIRADADKDDAIGQVVDELNDLIERERRADECKLSNWNHASSQKGA